MQEERRYTTVYAGIIFLTEGTAKAYPAPMPEEQTEPRILRVLKLYATRVLEPQAARLREYLEEQEKKKNAEKTSG